MKSTDLRAKARAIFGSAVAEPMPNQPNGAKALQQRANARPIPTYKVGGVVKKADGGAMPKLSTAERKMGDALMMKRKGKEVMDAQKRMESDKEMMRRKKQEAADKLLGIKMKSGGKACGGKAGKYAEGGDITAERVAARMAAGNYKKGGKVQTSADTAKKLATEMGGMKKGGKAKDGLAVMIAIGKTKTVKKAGGGEVSRQAPSATSNPANYTGGPTQVARAKTPVAPPSPKSSGPKFGMYMSGTPLQKSNAPKPQNMGGNTTLRRNKGGVVKKAAGGITLGNKRMYLPSTGSSLPQPVKLPSNLARQSEGVTLGNKTMVDTGTGMRASTGPVTLGRGAPVKKAVGGAGKTRKGMAPIKKAQGGVAKVRKGMMSETGDIKQVVKPKKGIGGM
jgi:hypothetical protein